MLLGLIAVVVGLVSSAVGITASVAADRRDPQGAAAPRPAQPVNRGVWTTGGQRSKGMLSVLAAVRLAVWNRTRARRRWVP